jgi:hypothetical protein
VLLPELQAFGTPYPDLSTLSITEKTGVKVPDALITLLEQAVERIGMGQQEFILTPVTKAGWQKSGNWSSQGNLRKIRLTNVGGNTRTYLFQLQQQASATVAMRVQLGTVKSFTVGPIGAIEKLVQGALIQVTAA